jgi:hypothetical protein
VAARPRQLQFQQACSWQNYSSLAPRLPQRLSDREAPKLPDENTSSESRMPRLSAISRLLIAFGNIQHIGTATPRIRRWHIIRQRQAID